MYADDIDVSEWYWCKRGGVSTNHIVFTRSTHRVRMCWAPQRQEPCQLDHPTGHPCPLQYLDVSRKNCLRYCTLYHLANVARRDTYNQHDLTHVSWVWSVLHRSCTTSRNGRLGSRWSRSWSVPTCELVRPLAYPNNPVGIFSLPHCREQAQMRSSRGHPPLGVHLLQSPVIIHQMNELHWRC